MLPRISEALSRFLTPIARLKNQVADPQKQKKEAFQRFKKKDAIQLASKPIQDEASSEADPSTSEDLVHPSDGDKGAALNFIQLVSSIQAQKATIPQKRGVNTYKSNQKYQKKGKFRKGTIIDQNNDGDAQDEKEDDDKKS